MTCVFQEQQRRHRREQQLSIDEDLLHRSQDMRRERQHDLDMREQSALCAALDSSLVVEHQAELDAEGGGAAAAAAVTAAKTARKAACTRFLQYRVDAAERRSIRDAADAAEYTALAETAAAASAAVAQPSAMHDGLQGMVSHSSRS